jgi:D-3-phosphoglycerate dehydrogenase
MTTAPTSYPKEKISFLLVENVHPAAVELLAEAGYTNVQTHKGALAPEALAERLPEVHVLGIRSKTKLTPELLALSKRLWGVGAFCIGTDQIALDEAARQGVAVFNSPFSSTRSVAELVIGSAIHLLRGITDKSAAAHAGRWLKAAGQARELRGKTLGIVGYGRIGSQLSVLAEALSVRVIFADLEPKLTMGSAKRVSLAELLAESDIVSLHVPDTPATRGLIGTNEFAQMKTGAIFINYARGHVVDVDALAGAVRSGHLGGAAVDVFPHEPASDAEAFESPLRGLPNVILTPHIGGSTEEAQANIGRDVAQKLIDYLDRGTTLGSVTLPELNLAAQGGAHRLLHLHRNQPGVLGEINLRLAQLGLNIVGQHLKTTEHLGYVVLDVVAPEGDSALTDAAIDALREVPGTLRVRSLY